MSSSKDITREEFDGLKIPFEDIKQATNDFTDVIARKGSIAMYKGELLRQENLVSVMITRYSYTEGPYGFSIDSVVALSKQNHENIISLVGFCEESGAMNVVYEFVKYGSLDKYLSSATKLTWLKRLQICLGAAHGLSYVHMPREIHDIYWGVVHGDVKTANILLDEKWEAKLANLKLSKLSDDRGQHPQFVGGTIGYVDPLYNKVGYLTQESDIYSFGVVLFEVLCGRPAFTPHIDKKQFLGPLARQYYEEDTIREIIDPILMTQMDSDSLNTFLTIAYQCLENDRSKRPKITEIIQRLEKSLGLQDEFENTLAIQQEVSFQHLKIPLKEIHLATNGFHADYLIGFGGFGGVYKAELFHFDGRKNDSDGVERRKSKVAIKKLDSRYGQGREQFLQEIKVLSVLNHQNIVSLVGFCDEDGEMLLVYEHASNGSLDRHIGKIQKVYSHTWAQRLHICLDVAYGLNYLHNKGIIHRDIKSSNVLIGHNHEGMIGDFGLSRISKNTNVDFSMTNIVGTPGYVHPKYARTGMLTKQSDIYSLGVVFLEVFCGRLAVLPKYGDDPEYLLHQAERHFQQKTLKQVIDPYLHEELGESCSISENESFSDSINTFAEITYKCLHNDQAHNITTMDIVKELKKAWTFHVKSVEMLSIEAIKSATNNFNEEHVIGKGASSKVYVGELSLSKGSTVVAMKRLERKDLHEDGGFFKKVAMLSSYVHENIIPLRGFCEEENEIIVVFDHVTNGSLDKQLDNSTLSWEQRLKISIGVANGLHYIHSFVKAHGDIKTRHILLDHDWKAVISDHIIAKCDDMFHLETDIQTKESNVYSFGVVLLEILLGRSVIEVKTYQETTARGKGKDDEVEFLKEMATLCSKKLEERIFRGIKEKADEKSIETFLAIAYRCLHEDKKERPTMAQVMVELEKAYKFQVGFYKIAKDSSPNGGM